MVEKEPTQEFTMPGLEAMTLKIWRNSRHSLELNRRVGCRRRDSLGSCNIHVVACAKAAGLADHCLLLCPKAASLLISAPNRRPDADNHPRL